MIWIQIRILVLMNQQVEAIDYKAKYEESQAMIKQLKDELANLRRLIYGKRRERYEHVPPEQLSLFDLPEEEEKPEPPQQEKRPQKPRKARKPHPGRNAIPDHLPTEEIIIEPDEDTTGMVKIGEERTVRLKYIKAQLIKQIITRPIYARAQDVEQEVEPQEKKTIYVAPAPEHPFPKCMADVSLLVYILVAKYVDHLPFYRQIQRFKREFGWVVHKSTINSWFIAVCTLLEPLYEVHRQEVLNALYLQVDESYIRVLTKLLEAQTKNYKYKKKSSTKDSVERGWMWVAHNPANSLVLFQYHPNRSTDGANALLEDFTHGYLQVDGWGSYNDICKNPKIIRVGCWAHVRRKFYDALNNHRQYAQHALDIIQQLYAIERRALEMELSPEEHLAYRQEHMTPLYEAFKAWLDENAHRVTPKSMIGKAFTYALNNWPYLQPILQDARIKLDNNLIENKIRPLALGRKNYLFAGSDAGAQRAAMMYSFFASCKAHDIDPAQWLTHTLNNIANTKRSQLHTLLPGYQKD